MQRIDKRRTGCGFTLLEILVAISIFAIMSTVALTGITIVLDSRQATEKVADQVKSLQNTLFYFDQDLRYAIDRGVRDEYGDAQVAMLAANSGPQGLLLTRLGKQAPPGIRRSNMLRVHYRLVEDRLIRSHYRTLDRAGEPQVLERILMENVEELEFRFLSSKNEWQSFWPPPDPDSEPASLPRAIEINLSLQDLGKITRLIPLTGY